MTDKVQKIKEWISKTQDGLMDDNGNFENPSDEGAFHILTNLDYYIDSLQEESVSIWHDSNKEQPEYGSDVVVLQGYEGDVLHRVVKVNPDRIWAYTNDLLNLTLHDSSDREKEPVSEELEEAARVFIEPYREVSECGLDYNIHPARVFKAGAKWQKEHLWKPADGDDLPEIDREVIALLNNSKVVFAHRPPEYWDGKNIITGKVTRNYPKTYGKGGWNIPDVKFWLDVEPPKEIEL